MKKGDMCKVLKTVSGGRPLVNIDKGMSVLIIKEYGGGYWCVYCAAKQGHRLTLHEKQLELLT